MARRILIADAHDAEWVQARYALQVDDYVEIHWKLPMAIDDWSGDITVGEPGYQITLRHELPRSPLQVYGQLVNAEDIEWLNKAIRADPEKRLVARVNEVRTEQSGGRPAGYQIEALTGPDARGLEDAERYRRGADLFRAHWWKVAIGLGVVWWLFI